jgi:hypothetical protein
MRKSRQQSTKLGRVKVVPLYAMDGAWGERSPGEGEMTPSTYCTKGWVGTRTGQLVEARGTIPCPCR